jgi:hypothetical protein
VQQRQTGKYRLGESWGKGLNLHTTTQERKRQGEGREPFTQKNGYLAKNRFSILDKKVFFPLKTPIIYVPICFSVCSAGRRGNGIAVQRMCEF